MLALTNHQTVINVKIKCFNHNNIDLHITGTTSQVIKYLKTYGINITDDNNFSHFISQLKNIFNYQNTDHFSIVFNDENNNRQYYPLVTKPNATTYIDLRE